MKCPRQKQCVNLNGRGECVLDSCPMPVTNADKIRSMSDEELASLLMYFADDTDGIEEKDYDAFADMEWRGRMLRWLKREAT